MNSRLRGAAATVAATCVLAVSACTPPDRDSAPATTSASDSYTVDSWETLGRAGLEWMGSCEEYGWGCYDDQVRTIIDTAKDLPPVPGRSMGMFENYRTTYSKYVAGDCGGSSPESICAVYVQQLSTIHGYLISALEDLERSG